MSPASWRSCHRVTVWSTTTTTTTGFLSVGLTLTIILSLICPTSILVEASHYFCRLPFWYLSAPGGWGNSWGAQGSQDYAYFDSGFAPGTRQHANRQRDSNMQKHYRTKRHRKITGPTRDQKIQIFFNITGRVFMDPNTRPLYIYTQYCKYIVIIILYIVYLYTAVSCQSFKLCPFSQQASLCPCRGTTL